MSEPIELTAEACKRLVRTGVVGRVALCAADGPHIVPLNYSVVDDCVVFGTSPYSVLGTFGRNSLLAFEVDHIDEERRHAWSVVVRGRCQWIDDADTIARVAQIQAMGSRPWAAGSRHLYLRLPLTDITGRRLGPPGEPIDPLRTPQPSERGDAR